MIKIYEVMAIEKGLPLFFQEHIDRFKKSIDRYRDYSLDDLTQITVNLIASILPPEPGKNIKIIYSLEENCFSIEMPESTRPPESTYTTGARTDLYKGERRNPLIKVVNSELQNKTRQYCKDNNLYDVLLVNNDGEITEGSRSNFLLINKDGELITSPEGDALEGITRKVLYRVCNKLGIKVIHKKILIRDLNEAKSLIITGTSPEILPVKSCGDINFDVDSTLIRDITKGFQLEKSLDYNLTGRYFSA